MSYTVYVGGPMTNRPHFNFPMFDAVTEGLRHLGWRVFNPHEHDQDEWPGIDDAEATRTGDAIALAEEIGFTMAGAMGWDLARVAEADGIVLLPEWETSTGARWERTTAEALGKDVWLVEKGIGGILTETGITFTSGLGVWSVVRDREQQRLTQHLATYGTPDSAGAVSSEVRVVDATTGGAKGSKLARFDLIPWDAMHQLAEHYGKGAEKYEPRNWERGYAWSLSFAALMRHLSAWWGGEDIDAEGFEHLTAVFWHAAALRTFALRALGTDDRPAA